MNEFDLIRRLTAGLPRNETVVVGAGDDCAVLDLGLPDRVLLFKTDAVVEGVHFGPDAPPEKIGHKAIARCLSDIAAMAGTPSSALVTLALPRDHDVARIEALYSGMNATARRHGVAIVGGETTANPGGMLISIAMLGTVEKGKCPLRSGARAGDAVFVTGELGGSLAGRHLDFEPRLAEARWLAANTDLHAMIDLSDGLAGDLRRLIEASHAGAELHGPTIPISRAARQHFAAAPSTARPPLPAALTDGEDFELLFTVAARDAVAVKDGFRAAFPELPLTCVGRITAEPGLRLRDARGLHELHAQGYAHFAQPV